MSKSVRGTSKKVAVVKSKLENKFQCEVTIFGTNKRFHIMAPVTGGMVQVYECMNTLETFNMLRGAVDDGYWVVDLDTHQVTQIIIQDGMIKGMLDASLD